ncbi:MAG: fatty acid--CoA ligase family protein [Proteobacteria bacterium]|nr:fatty acid--CoA ligase family protein [Pseudomonadota bacterium]
MNMLHELLNRFSVVKEKTALVSSKEEITYGQLLSRVQEAELLLKEHGCEGKTVLLIGDYTSSAIACLLALWRLGNVVALCCANDDVLVNERVHLAQATRVIRTLEGNQIAISHTDIKTSNPILSKMNRSLEFGFVIFSSGSTGQSKASIHSASAMLGKHVARKRCLTSISFLLFDHIGGLNTLFYILFNVGKLIVPPSRLPEAVAQAIEKHRVESITVSPTFLNLSVMSGVLTRYNLSSLQVVSYGTEPMPETLLAILIQQLPWVSFSQAYGLTETGVLPVKSVASSSTWLRFDKTKCDVRIVNGLLEVKVNTSMLGYLNAPSPFTLDGYLKTGDMAQKEGDNYRVVGRQSELINVGGEKVYPSAIENVLRDIPGVLEVAVTALDNPIMGKVVGAVFRLKTDEELTSFRRRLYEFCHQKLPSSHIPRKITFTDTTLHTERSKKLGGLALQSIFNQEKEKMA